MSLEFLDMLSSLIGIGLSLCRRKARFAFMFFITRWKVVVHGAIHGYSLLHVYLNCSASNRVHVLEKLCMNLVTVCQEFKIVMLLNSKSYILVGEKRVYTHHIYRFW